MKNIQYHPLYVSREYPRKSLQIKLGKKGDKYVYRSTKDLPFCESTVTTVNTSHSLEPFARSSLTVFLRCDFTHAPFFHPLPRLLFSFFLLSYKLVKLSPSRSNLIPLITRSNPPSFLSVCPLLSCRFALFTSSRDIYPNIFVPRPFNWRSFSTVHCSRRVFVLSPIVSYRNKSVGCRSRGDDFSYF